MKKIFTFLAVATAISAGAANPVVLDRDFCILPEVVTAKGEAYIAVSDMDTYIKVYDANFAEKINITLPGKKEYQLKQWQQQRKYGPGAPTLTATTEVGSIIEINGNDLNISLNDAIADLQNYCFAEKATFNGETVIATSYFQQEYFNNKYVYEFYKLVDGRWTSFRNEYRDGQWGPTDEWEERREETVTEESDVIADPDLQTPTAYGDELYVTQAFFNNDDKFEYIVPVQEIREFSKDYETSRRGGQTLVTTGFEVKSDQGTSLMTLTIPEEYIDAGSYSKSYIKLMIFGNKKYVAVSGDDVRLLYDIDQTSGVKAPAMVIEGMKVNPAAPRHGESVTVDLGTEAQPGCSINLCSTAGRNVMTLGVAAGTTSATIPTGSLAPGMYVVTLANGTTPREAAKIIVR